jgi:D-threo-aldose 1-dehydrogenase
LLNSASAAPRWRFRATISDAEATAMIDAAYEDRVRYFDTSPFYGYGRGELRMGAALRERPRDEYGLSTKVGRVPPRHEAGRETAGRFFATTACPALRRCSITPTTA